MGQAFIQAVRQVWRRRSLSIAVIAIMAVSIGSCVAIFGMVKAVLLDDWGYADPDRIAIVWHARQSAPGVVGMSPSDYQSHRTTLASAETIAAVTTRGVNLGTGTTPSRITCARMTDGMFPLLGVPPARGRWITADDDRAGSKVVVVSAVLAKQLSGQGDVIGGDINLDGIPHRVIGVMPASFSFPPEGIQGLTSADCWLPASFTPMELAIPGFNYVLFARLKTSASMTQMNAEAHAGAQRIWSTYPAAVQSQVRLTARAVPLTEQALARSRTPLMLFAGAVIGLLLIGCANVSNLMLTAFESRRTELSVRTSLGAPRSTIVGQLLMESMLLSVAGGVAGVTIAWGLLSAMIAANATAFPRLAAAQIDLPALVFALACGIVSGLAGAVWPAMQTTRAGVQLQGAGPRVAARGFGGTIWRRGLIAFELALAVVVLILAGVLFRSVASLNQVETGFATTNLLTFSVSLPEAKYKTREQIASFGDEVLQRLRVLPSITSASVSTAPPIGEAAATVVFAASQAATGPEYKPALAHAVSASYLRTLGLRLQSGRFIEVTDAPQAMPVAVVNESLARALFPDGRAIGSSFSRIGSARPITIVGLVADTRQAGPLRPPVPALYLPFAQNDQPARSLNLAVQTALPISRLAPDIRRSLAQLDAEVPPFAMKTGAELVNDTIAIQRFNMLVIGVFAAFALILAISGLYAVLAQSVQQARRDFGIRQALGATGGRIARSVLGRALVPAVAGVLVGGIAASAAAELIASQLFGVEPNDPITFVASAVFVLAISTLVVSAPALRAARVNLSTLLRHE
jgi:putative ABC transport system permease protein